MTFNNIEISRDRYYKDFSHIDIYDGSNLAMLHDGRSKYLYLKNQNITVVIPEQNAENEDVAYIGASSSRIYTINSTYTQLNSISTTGTTLQEEVVQLNNFNRLKDFSYVGTNNTLNTFYPKCGYVQNNLIVIGGHIGQVSSGLNIESKNISQNSTCYMYSNNSGASFKGPFFPLINKTTSSVLTEDLYAITYINDNWYFYHGNDTGGQLSVAQSIGVDFIADPLLTQRISTTNQPNYQAPLFYFNNAIYYQGLERNTYYRYSLLDNNNYQTVYTEPIFYLKPIGDKLYICLKDSCDPIIVNRNESSARNTIGVFTIGESTYRINVGLGKTLIDEESENIESEHFNSGSKVNSDHYIQPGFISNINDGVST